MEMSIWPSTTQFEQHFRLVQHCIDVILHKTKESVNFFQLALDSTHLSFSLLQLLYLCCARKEERLPIGSCCWTSQAHHPHLAHQCSSKRTETFVLQASIVRTLETPRSSVKTTKNMYIYMIKVKLSPPSKKWQPQENARSFHEKLKNSHKEQSQSTSVNRGAASAATGEDSQTVSSSAPT